ncbi:FAD-dependent monooxygenase [Streptomyces sp. NPDC006512]|uniref:FAD-dependent monooxygenase n=1 Tax=Streptomyces sp. NPDC006512 TaxID=3154307 RepID=UPI0033ABDA73
MRQDTDVLVVGAGPTGLALAVDLARRGVRALVVERAGGLFPGSRGKGLQPRTLEVLDDLGLHDAVRAAGAPYPVGMVWQDGVRQGEHRMFDEAEPDEGAPYGAPWLVPQWRTQEVLFARLVELGGGVAFGRELTSLTQDPDGVTATFASGAPVRARYAVAADGGRSTVRRSLGIGMTGETVDPHPVLVADVRVTGLDRDHWHLFPPADGGGYLAVCPLPGTDLFQVVAQFPEAAEVDLSPAGIREAVAARSHLAPAQVTEVRWASDFRPRAAMADRFRAGRVFLAGDAAHVHSPAGGQGLNTSVQDAYNLGWKLGAVLRDGAPASLLDSYEEERLPVAAGMLGLSTRIHRGEARRGEATRQLGLGYRDSSLAVETRTGLPEDALRAGDRAPDGSRDGVRLFDAFRGPQWTLLAVGAGAGAALPELPGVRTVRFPSYGAYGDGVFLVRPDGYVGWAGGTATGAAAYAARFGL